MIIIKIRVLRKVISKQFCFIRCRRQHLRVAKKSWYSRFTFLKNTISNFQKVTRVKFVESDRLLLYEHLQISRILFQWLLACLNFTLDGEDLSCWYKQKKCSLWAVTEVQAAENHGDNEAWPDIHNEEYIRHDPFPPNGRILPFFSADLFLLNFFFFECELCYFDISAFWLVLMC